MYAPSRYLEWARRRYGKVAFDLATSGMPTVMVGELPGAAEDADAGDLRRQDLLRGAIAAHNAVPVAEAIATLGTTQAYWLACATMTGPGDDILVEAPGYEPLTRIAEGVGARVTTFERVAADRFRVDPERVAAALTPRTRLIVVTNLHNPSGVRTDDSTLRELAKLAARTGAWLLVDEVYAEFDALVDERGVFEGSARRLAANVVAVSSLTKCYGLGPHRIGWMLAPADVVANAEHTMTAACGALPLSHAQQACRTFHAIQTLAAKSRTHLDGKRDLVARWVAENGFGWSAPEEGLFALVTLAGRGDLTATIESAAHEHEVLVAAGSFFGVPNGFRLAWSAPRDKLSEGLSRLSAALAER